MRASALVTLRSALMVAFLVVVPIAAMFGTSSLNPVDLLYPRTSGRQDDDPVRDNQPQRQPRESPTAADRTPLPEAVSLEAPSSGQSTNPPQRGNASVDTQVGLRTPTVPSQHRSDVHSKGAGNAATLPVAPGREGKPGVGVNRRGPAGRPAEGGGSSPPTADVLTLDRLRRVERRLRALGATYYRLETWGADGRQYRFFCQMPAAQRPDYQQVFQAVDDDWLGAMEQVLGEVEAWRGGRPWESPR